MVGLNSNALVIGSGRVTISRGAATITSLLASDLISGTTKISGSVSTFAGLLSSMVTTSTDGFIVSGAIATTAGLSASVDFSSQSFITTSDL